MKSSLSRNQHNLQASEPPVPSQEQPLPQKAPPPHQPVEQPQIPPPVPAQLSKEEFEKQINSMSPSDQKQKLGESLYILIDQYSDQHRPDLKALVGKITNPECIACEDKYRAETDSVLECLKCLCTCRRL